MAAPKARTNLQGGTYMKKSANVSLPPKKQTIWNPEFTSIFIINVIINMGQFMMNTLVPKYAEHLGATAAMVGMVSGMFAITSLSIRPVVGPATSYFRKNRLLAVTVGILIAAFICYGFADSIPIVIIGRLLHGVGMGFLAPITLALASNVLPDERMASGIGIFSLGQAFATAVGPTIGLALENAVGYNTTFFFGAVLMGVALVLSLQLKTEAPNRTQRFKVSLSNMIAPEVIIPAIIMFFLGGAYSCINSFVVIYGGVCGVDGIGLFFTAYAVFVLFSRPFSGKIADKYGVDKVVIPGMLIFALSFFIISFARSLPMFILAGAVSAFGYGICQPAIQTLCMTLVSKDRRGLAGNTNYIGVDIGYLTAPVLGGAIVTFLQQHGGTQLQGYAAMYRIMTIPVFIALIIFLACRKKLITKGPMASEEQTAP